MNDDLMDLIKRFLGHIRHDVGAPMVEVEIEGDLFDGVLTGELAEIVQEMQEAVDEEGAH